MHCEVAKAYKISPRIIRGLIVAIPSIFACMYACFIREMWFVDCSCMISHNNSITLWEWIQCNLNCC